MRSGVLLSLALSLFSAESLASPCIPQSASSSGVTVSSAASTSLTSSEVSLSSTVTETSTETETETSKATESSATTETPSSTESATSETASTTVSSYDSTTLSTESTTAVSSTESASSTEPASSSSVTESATSGSTTQSTTESAESSTSEAASTSSTSVDPCATPNPNPAFKAVVQGSGGNQVMRSNGQHGSSIVLDTTADGYEPMAFTVEPCTNLLRQTNGKYVCVSYGTDDYFPPQIITCQLPAINWFTPVYCEQPVAGQPLVCHAQRGECAPGCRPKAGTPWSQFYSKASPDPFTPATLLHFGNSIAEGRPQSYTPVDFVAQLYSADPPAPTE
ncbi:hypothetical protein CEP54_009745 [Fusarium duplospermum]|uniref:Uncharacterized protein n=1 Tax=Fusarium duplospermum TaxID=1325734 RepID=A0A428PNP2_9HYPO|nr:hypothetical protein CEP54_009745 [Fusarium duplospermum]